MPTGVELAVVLAGIDTAQISNYDRGVGSGSGTRPVRRLPAVVQPSQWADGEVAALYTCSERAARQELDFAEQVVTHMPLVFEAMLAGRLDRATVWVFADYLHDLLPEHQDALCAALVEPAVGWTPGKLANRLRRMILEHDPDWAARRYRAAIRRAGHPSLLAQIRADLYLGLLDGSLSHLTRAQIIATMLGDVRPQAQPLNPAPPASHHTAPTPTGAPPRRCAHRGPVIRVRRRSDRGRTGDPRYPVPGG
jgi:hypothetical protein